MQASHRAPKSAVPRADLVKLWGRQHLALRLGERRGDAAESKTLGMHGDSKRENREILEVSAGPRGHVLAGRNGQQTPQVARLT